jgi:hypothetical protein
MNKVKLMKLFDHLKGAVKNVDNSFHFKIAFTFFK